MIHISGLFSAGKYINLDIEPAKKKLLESEFLKYGFPVPERFNAILDDNPRRGCARSHYACIKEAEGSGSDYVLVLEDDVVFIRDKALTLNILNNAISFIEKNRKDINIFYLGFTPCQPCERVADDVYRVQHGYGSYAYIVLRENYSKILGILENAKCVDTAFYEKITSQKKSFFSPVFSVRSGLWSNLKQQIRNTVNQEIIRSHERWLNTKNSGS